MRVSRDIILANQKDESIKTYAGWFAEQWSVYPAETRQWQSVCWADGIDLFVASTGVATSDKGIMTSPDGKTWTLRNTPVGFDVFNAVVWAPDLNLVLALGNNRAIYSSNGIDWTLGGSHGAPSNGVIRIPELGLFVCPLYSGDPQMIATSPDGITWTLRNTPLNIGWSCLAWSPKEQIIVVLGETNPNTQIMTSTNAIDWTLRSIPSSDCFWRSVCWADKLGLFVAVGSSSSNVKAMISSNGVDWTLVNAPNSAWKSVCWSEELGLLVAVGDSLTNRVMTSTNGIDWTLREFSENSNWKSVCWSKKLGQFTAVSATGTNRAANTRSGLGRGVLL